MTRELSIAFQTDKTPEQYRELAALVDRYDFDAVTVYGDLPFQPSYGALHIMAPLLQRARIGVAGVTPSRMTPLDMAGETALLDHLTHGRAYLGVVRGAWLEKHGIRELQPPVTAIREAVEIVKLLLRGDDSGYQGEVFQIAAGVKLPYPVLRSEVPILIGTWGQKLAKVAADLADEVKLGGCANPDMVPVMRGWLGNDTVGIVVGAVCVVDEDGRAAKQTVKRDLALYLPVVAGLDKTVQIDPELLTRIGKLVDSGQRDQAAALISDDLLSKFAFAGTPAEIAAQAAAIFEAGASRVEFGTPHGIDPLTGIKLLGEQVLPALRR